MNSMLKGIVRTDEMRKEIARDETLITELERNKKECDAVLEGMFFELETLVKEEAGKTVRITRI